jgi:hypothetical protein
MQVRANECNLVTNNDHVIMGMTLYRANLKRAKEKKIYSEQNPQKSPSATP